VRGIIDAALKSVGLPAASLPIAQQGSVEAIKDTFQQIVRGDLIHILL
jgi:hypothetical protein